MQWYLKALKNYGNFSGRATRKEYWIFSLSNIVIFGYFYFIIIFRGVSCYYCVAIYVSNDYTKFSVGARRLHDIGKSGMVATIKFCTVW